MRRLYPFTSALKMAVSFRLISFDFKGPHPTLKQEKITELGQENSNFGMVAKPPKD
jgi:hypothetical protein